MAKKVMAVTCILTFQYKYLTLIQLRQVGRLTTTMPLSRERYSQLKKISNRINILTNK